MHWYFLTVEVLTEFWHNPGGVGGIFATLIGCGTISMEGVDTVGGEDDDVEPLLRAYRAAAGAIL